MSAGPLVDVDEVARLLGTVTILDVRYRMGSGPSGLGEYDAGHLPGASYVDMDTALAAPPGAGGRHPLPATEVFEAAMRAAGVSGDRAVVVYDDWAGHAAARCWWLLRYHGHQDVRVLDGGWSAWKRAGLPIATGRSGARRAGHVHGRAGCDAGRDRRRRADGRRAHRRPRG